MEDTIEAYKNEEVAKSKLDELLFNNHLFNIRSI